MSKTINEKKLDAAIELGFLSKTQIESLDQERRESNYPVLEIAIRNGLLDRKQLEILNIFSDPESVVPGYRIEGFLGQGSVGTVYKAMQIRMDRPVAIKTIRRAAARNDLTLKRFEREARIVGQLRHPNIIPAFDFGIHNEKLYLIMEFVDGVDAEKQLLQRGRFPESHAWFIARQVCHALDNAHQLGIIHRDIKPGNLILTEPPAGTPMPVGVPFVKVADFGLAKFSDRPKDATITIEQSVSGTPFYMSPEQIQALEIDHRSDIYSLGATIWHFISGAPPVAGKGPLDVISNKMKLEDTWLESTADMSPSGFQLLARMCRHDREQRIDDYAELSREIDAVIGTIGESPLPDRSGPATHNGFSPAATLTTIRELAKTYSSQVDLDGNGGSDDFLLADSASASDVRFASDARFETEHDQTPVKNGDVAEKLKSRLRSPILWAVPLLCGLILAAAIYFFAKPESGQVNFGNQDVPDPVAPDQAVETPRIQLTQLSGLPIYLFNGTEVDATQKFMGTWEAAKGGADGNEGVVLAGSGTREFRCRDLQRKPLDYFRFVCGFRHHNSDLIEFKLFDRNEPQGDGDDDGALFRVLITPDMATLIAGETTYRCDLQQFDDERSFGFHQFRILSQPGYWRIEVDQESLGEIDKPAGFVGDNSLIQLSVTGEGSAHFEGISFCKLAGKHDEN